MTPQATNGNHENGNHILARFRELAGEYWRKSDSADPIRRSFLREIASWLQEQAAIREETIARAKTIKKHSAKWPKQ